MPQKKNPDGLEDMKSVAAQSLGVVATVMMAEKGPTGFPIMERRNSQAILWELGRNLGVRFESLAPLLRDLDVRRERMRELAGANWAQVTDVAAALVRHSATDWRTAHQIVGVFVRQCVQAGIRPAQAQSAHLDAAARSLGRDAPGLSAGIFADAMDPAAFVERRKLLGGPAAQALTREIASARLKLAADEQQLAALNRQVEQAREHLEQAITVVIGS
jgi:argininosuccinate lyase